MDPITLIFIGYAPSRWVATTLAGWSDSAYCSGPKKINGGAYNYTLEHPDPTGLPCLGPRDHVRIWDMGYNPVFGEWSIASAHHEHTVCDPVCHHVIDSWVRAESDVRSSFLNGPATLSISNYPLANAGYFQGVFNDGNPTMIQLKPPSGHYPLIFNENGLGNQTFWSVAVNGTTIASQRPDIVFGEPNGTYFFTVGTPAGFNSTPASGKVTVDRGGTSQNILFRTPWTTSTVTLDSSGRQVSIGFTGNSTIMPSTVQLSTGADITVSFMVKEIGAVGALNVTLPRSTVPPNASPLVYVDGMLRNNEKLTSDTNNYYLYFLLLYGTHSVELQFAPPNTPYLEYAAGGALAVGLLGVLFITFRMRWRWKQRGRR
jgi:hypothetical protein